MSLLMPEYERQLRAAARRLAEDRAVSVRRARGGLGSWLLLALAGGVALAVAVGALILIGHHGSPNNGTPASARPPIQYDCAPGQILHARGRLVTIGHGTIDGQRWRLEVDGARHGLRSVQAGRLLLGGRPYGFCSTRLDVELVNAGPHGIVYGLAGRPYRPPIVIEATTAHGTRAHPVATYQYPAMTRQVPEAILFLRALPASACRYRRGLAVDAPERPTADGTGSSTITFVDGFTHSCASGQLLQSPQQRPGSRSRHGAGRGSGR